MRNARPSISVIIPEPTLTLKRSRAMAISGPAAMGSVRTQVIAAARCWGSAMFISQGPPDAQPSTAAWTAAAQRRCLATEASIPPDSAMMSRAARNANMCCSGGVPPKRL